MYRGQPGSALREIRLDVGGSRLHCLTAGPKPGTPVLLLPGASVDSARLSYRHAIQHLARRYRVFAPDWPGQGQSEEPGLARTSFARTTGFYVDFVGRLMDALELERAHLVGLSLGGAAALGFALQYPERTRKLVLVSAYGLGSPIPRHRLVYLLVNAPPASSLLLALARRSPWLVRRRLSYLLADERSLTEELVAEVRGELLKPGAGRAFVSLLRSEVGWHGGRTDFSDRLPELRAPTLLIHGERDPLVRVEAARRAHKLIPRSELAVFEGCGHWPPREHPQRFNSTVSGFLAR